MTEYYYLNERKEQQGPVGAEELMRTGVGPNTLVWREGLTRWTPAGDVAELNALFLRREPAKGSAPLSYPSRSSNAGGAMSKPNNWLVVSILVTLFCCLPGGVVAIIYAAKVDNLWNSGQHEEATKAARTARTLCLASICVGLVLFILIFFFNVTSVMTEEALPVV